MESMTDLPKNHFSSVVGKSEVSDFVQSLRKSLGNYIARRPNLDCFGCRLESAGGSGVNAIQEHEGGGFPIHPDLFAQIDFRLFC